MSASDTQVLALRPCPCCEALGVLPTSDNRWETCALCDGDKFVSHFRAAHWELQRGKTDDFSRLAESSKPPPRGE